eukprot:1216624-Amphidinium_carterae.1
MSAALATDSKWPQRASNAACPTNEPQIYTIFGFTGNQNGWKNAGPILCQCKIGQRSTTDWPQSKEYGAFGQRESFLRSASCMIVACPSYRSE